MSDLTNRMKGWASACAFLLIGSVSAEQHPGGILESVTDTQARTAPSSSEIQSFLPSRGEFNFPSPWNTEGIRITNASDCGGNDCVWYVAYSYWRNINNHAGRNDMYIFVGLNRSKGGTGPTLFRYDKSTGSVTNEGGLFDSSHSLSWATGEGWYFSATRPTKLYINHGSSMMRYDVETKSFTTVIDIQAKLQSMDPGSVSASLAEVIYTVQSGTRYHPHQMHSSNNDRIHSFSLRNSSTYSTLGCMIYDETNGDLEWFPKEGSFDECQVGPDGQWLLIKENDDNRIIDLTTGNERMLLDADGAVGHSDMGFGYVVGQNNMSGTANTWDVLGFGSDPLSHDRAYYGGSWFGFSPSHMSHTNASATKSVAEQYACGGGATSNTEEARTNEIICFGMNGSGDVLSVAPVMTDVDSSVGGDSYSKQPKGNLDPTGEYFIWTTNAGGSRVDAYIVKVPGHLLTGTSSGGGGAGTTDPVPTEPDPVDGADTTPPDISVTSTVVGSNDVTVSWTTNESADSQVEYGTSTSYGKTTSTGPMGTSHSRQVTGLSAGVTYHMRLLSTDAAGNRARSNDISFTTTASTSDGSGTGSTGDAGDWTDVNNMSVSGGSLSKTGGCDGCGDAGARSVASIGDGFLEFTVAELAGLRYLGLSSNPAGDSSSAIDYAVRLQGDGYAEVRENGTYRAYSGYSAGDVFRIEARGGKVTYARNGQVFYTSTAASTAPLFADTVYHSLGGKLSNVVLSSSSTGGGAGTDSGDTDGGTDSGSTDGGTDSGSTDGGTDSGSTDGGSTDNGSVDDGTSDPVEPPATTAGNVNWQNLENVNLTSDGGLEKVGGADGAADAGANSTQQLKGEGYLTFNFGDATSDALFGFASTASGNDPRRMDYGLRVINGNLEVREFGNVRTQVAIAPGDVLRIAQDAWGRVTYAKNAEVFYTSGRLNRYRLRVDAVMYGIGSRVYEPVLTDGPAPGATTAVKPTFTWQNLDNVDATPDGGLRKRAGCDGCADAGANSVEQLKGAGYLEFGVADVADHVLLGFASTASGNRPEKLDYGLQVRGGVVEVVEFGNVRTHVSVTASDVLRVAQDSNGKVTYAKNGQVFYNSGRTNRYPLRVDGVLYSLGVQVIEPKLVEGAVGSTTSPVLTGDAQPVAWENLANAVDTGDSILKQGGCDGCSDAGANSKQKLEGAGYAEFTLDDTTTLRQFGLASTASGNDGGKVDYSIRIQGGSAEVREFGDWKSWAPIVVGDIFRIAVDESGVVTYLRNGEAFYTSERVNPYPLRADSVLYSAGSKVVNPLIKE